MINHKPNLTKKRILVMEDEVKDYEEKYFKGHYCANQCSRCKGRSLIKRGSVSRQFRYFKTMAVLLKYTIVGIWQCKNCGVSFRHLPEFLAPNKLFTKSSIREKAECFLDTEHSYRESSQNSNGSPKMYEEKELMGFSHVSIWNWLIWYASLHEESKLHQIRTGAKDIFLASASRCDNFLSKSRSIIRYSCLIKASETLYILR